MTTSAGIASGTNSFNISLGRGARFSTYQDVSESTSDQTAGLPAPADDDSSSSQDSGSSEGSTFHSVLHQLDSWRGDDSSGSSSDTSNVTGKTVTGKTVTSSKDLSAAIPTLPLKLLVPLKHDGTILRTLTSSTSATNVQTVTETSPAVSNTSDTGASEVAPQPASAPSPQKQTEGAGSDHATKDSSSTTQTAAPVVEIPRSIIATSMPQDGTEIRSTSFLRAPASSTSAPNARPVSNPVATTAAAPADPAPSPTESRSSATATTAAPKDYPPEDNQPAKPSAAVATPPALAIQPEFDTPKNSPPSPEGSQPATVDPKSPSTRQRATPTAANDVAPDLQGAPLKPEISAPRNTSFSNPPPVRAHSAATATAPTKVPIQPAASTGPVQPAQHTPRSVDAADQSLPPISTSVDESSFSSVLSQMVSQPDPAQRMPSADAGDARQSPDEPVVNSVSPPPKIAQTRATGATVSASQPTQEGPPRDQPSNATNPTTTPIDAVDPLPAALAAGTKPANSDAQSRVNVPLPTIEPSTTSAAPASSGELAFAARLTPNTENTALPDTTGERTRPPQTIPDKPSGDPSPLSTDAAAAPDRSHTAPAPEQLAKADLSSPQPVQPAIPPAPATRTEPAPAQPNQSAAARMEQVIETPAAPQTSSRDITIRVPDATDRGTDVRFIERGGEIHVSVRTSDPEVAQTLRGGLGDFVGRMEHTGIRAEVWKPSLDATPSQSDSQHQSPDQRNDQRSDSRGSGSGKNQPGSDQREDHRRQAEKPGWVEELETSFAQPSTQSIQ